MRRSGLPGAAHMVATKAGCSSRHGRNAGAAAGRGCSSPWSCCSWPPPRTTIFTLPHGSLRINADGLPQLHAPRFSGRLVSISVRSSDGSADSGRRELRRHAPADAPGRARDASRGAGRVPTLGAGRLAGRAHRDRQPERRRAERADRRALAAGEGRGAGAGELRPPGARGRRPNRRPDEDAPPAGPGAHGEPRQARRRGNGRRQRRPARLGAPAAADERHLVPAGHVADAARVTEARRGTRPGDPTPAALLRPGRPAAARPDADARSRRPRHVAHAPTRTRSSSHRADTGSGSTGA